MGLRKYNVMESVEITDENKSAKERVVLDDDTLTTLNSYQEQFEKEFGGVVKLNLKQLVNFLLVERVAPLSQVELSKVRSRFTDKVKILQAIVERAKAARRDGQDYSIDDDLKIFETLSVSEKPRTRKPRKARQEEVSSPEIPGEIASATEAMVNNGGAYEAPPSKEDRPRKSRASAKIEGA